jgi:CheY-like chemotaxis protein
MEINKLQELIKQTKNLTVLYVEDNAEVQTQTIKMLESFFNNIFVANDGKVCLELFLKNPNNYHLIITDIKMPILDGIGMIETIREIDKKIPILVSSTP